MSLSRSLLVTLLSLPLVSLAEPPPASALKAAAAKAAATKSAKDSSAQKAGTEAGCHHPAPPANAPTLAGWHLSRGEPLKGAPAVPLQQLLAKPQAHEGKTVRLEGKVRKACQKKGCWMELAEDEKGAGVRVTFKDYAFFVPLDSAGSLARVEGVVKVKELSEATAKHYEDEGAIVPRGSDGKPREVQLVAIGVELHR